MTDLTTAVSEQQIILHNSMLSTFTDCEQRFEYSYKRGWRPPATKAMERGTWFHALAAVHNVQRGIRENTLLRIPETLDLGVPGLDAVPVDGLTPAGALEQMADLGYSPLPASTRDEFDGDDKVYGEEFLDLPFPGQVWDLFERWLWHEEHNYEPRDVLLVEEEWTNEYRGLTFGGRIDLLARRRSGPVVLSDTKTTSSLPSMSYRLTNLQILLYAWGIEPLLDLVGADETPRFVELDYIITKPPSMLRLKKNLSKKAKEAEWDYEPYANVGSMDQFSFMAQSQVLGVDPMHDAFADIRAEIDGYTNDDHPYFRRWEMVVNPRTVRRLLDQHVDSYEKMAALWTGEKEPIRNLHPILCGMCEHSDECALEFQGGTPEEPSKGRTLPLTTGGELTL